MTTKKALFVGCSFTADCGFTIENQYKYHWPWLFCQALNFEITNSAIGGMSNDEIFFRTVEAVTKDRYDLVVVMWSEVSRRWGYCSHDNIDDFTILNNGSIKGNNADLDYVTEYAKAHHLWFNNRYINIKHWLLHSWSLENTLKSLGTQFVFIKGFDNSINTIHNVGYNKGFTNIQSIRSMFDFDNRPDDYIQSKLNVLQKLILAQDQVHWLNLLGTSFFDMSVDVADDKLHPGPNTNQKLANNLINLYKRLNEQSI